MNSIVRKFMLGEHLTDDEMEHLRHLCREVVACTEPFGETYDLVRRDATDKLQRIEACLRARQRVRTARRPARRTHST